eukprot:TRINITY_DN1665_c0_g1_i3.p1 TRINITY_DN1665_c0_g1~~TRINITY_DN1665_c0_g1_i3.p1  ORF type:complete len:313 (-),score=43.65 TRINITY_DN1665_c0_g1_i3:1296-2234(-)
MATAEPSTGQVPDLFAPTSSENSQNSWSLDQLDWGVADDILTLIFAFCMDHSTLPTLNRVSHKFRGILKKDPRFLGFMKSADEKWWICVMEHGLPRLRVFNTEIFLNGSVRFSDGRVRSHLAIRTFFRGALMRETGSIHTDNGTYCITPLGSCRFSNPVHRKTWLRRFHFPPGYKIYQTNKGLHIPVYGGIEKGSLIVSLNKNKTDTDSEEDIRTTNTDEEEGTQTIDEEELEIQRPRQQQEDEEEEDEEEEGEGENEILDMLEFGVPVEGVEGGKESVLSGRISFEDVEEVHVWRARYDGNLYSGLSITQP